MGRLIGFLIGVIIVLNYGWMIQIYKAEAGDTVYSGTKVRRQPPPEVVPDDLLAPLKINGLASWYIYTLPSGWSSKNAMVCAARDFPRYSYVKITSIVTGKSTVCKITDYGPDKAIHPDRVADLSPEVFAKIGNIKLGLEEITIESYGGNGNN